MTLRKIVPIALLTALALGAAARPAHSDIPLPGPGPSPPDTLYVPYVTSWHTEPAVPCVGVPTRLVFSGFFPTSCGALLKADSDSLVIRFGTASPICGICAPESLAWTATIDLGLLAAGSFTVRLRFDVVDTCVTPEPRVDQYLGRLHIDVAPACAQPNPIAYVDSVLVTPLDSASEQICPDDSIRVTVKGTFPNSCLFVRHVLLVPTVWWSGALHSSETPPPPTVRLVFDDQCCSDLICTPTTVKWSGSVTLPPMPAGLHNLDVQAVQVCCRDSVLPGDPHGTLTTPFTVTSAESCGTESRVCLEPIWDHSGRVGRCDTELSPDLRAELTLGIRSTNALAGLQGKVHVGGSSGAPHLQIVSMEPTGPATGMHLTWQPLPDGASFVMFADAGAPIPASDSTLTIPPVLRLTFAQTGPDSGGAPPPDSGATTVQWFVSAYDFLGADATGGGVPQCLLRTNFAAEMAVICAASGMCDLNADSHADVRDLVLMVRCMHGSGPCPADPPTALDCDGDHDFDLDDVLCCARRVLLTPGCPGCWGDSSRTDGAIAFQFGTPLSTGDGYDIPIRIVDSGSIGAARLVLQMPDALASAASIRTANVDPDWLVLDEARPGQRVVGLMNLVSERKSDHPVPLDLVLHVPVTNGNVEITLGTAEFSGSDGVRLVTDLGTPAVRIGGGVSVVLDAAQPNPFSATTAFALSLDAAADVDLGVYDLAGRRVAALYHGRLEIGVHRYAWNGRADDGTRASAGVYFVRASAGGTSTVRKLVFVKG